MDSGNNSIVELGRFLTGFLVVMGIGRSCDTAGCAPDDGRKTCTDDTVALPIVLAHCDQIKIPAMIMSIIGGLLIYGTIISFGLFFREQEEF